MTYCYIRVSTDKQDYDRQVKILIDKGYIENEKCKYITETYTGKTKDRPKFEKLLDNLKENDFLVATELSRISRSVKDFQSLLDIVLKEKRANIYIIKENFNLIYNESMDAVTKLFLNITSAFAEFERDLISDRTKESLKAKKEHGVILGRPKKERNINDFLKVLAYMIEKNVGQQKATIRLGYPRSTFQRQLKEYYLKYKTKDYKKLFDKICLEVI